MSEFEGWTKMDEYSWRHDGSEIGQNKLNIFLKDEDEYKNMGEHAGDVNLNGYETYLVVYTVNDAPTDVESGSHILSEHSSLRDAENAASKIRQENPNSEPV